MSSHNIWNLQNEYEIHIEFLLQKQYLPILQSYDSLHDSNISTDTQGHFWPHEFTLNELFDFKVNLYSPELYSTTAMPTHMVVFQ